MDKDKLLQILLTLLGQASSFKLLDDSGHEVDDIPYLAAQVKAAQETGKLIEDNVTEAIKIVKGANLDS